MKTSWLILGVLGGLAGISLASEALAPPSDLSVANPAQQNAAGTEASFVPRDPWRAIEGVTNYVEKDGAEFCGKIVDVTKDGVRIAGSFGKLFRTNYNPSAGAYDEFLVANFPDHVLIGQVIPEDEHLMAWQVGTDTNSTVTSGVRAIKKLDYGIPCDPPAGWLQKPVETAKAYAIGDKKIAEQKQIYAVVWLKTHATNGPASAQCSLALHLLNGQGCETNRELAIYWLQKACGQGSTQATNILASLKP